MGGWTGRISKGQITNQDNPKRQPWTVEKGSWKMATEKAITEVLTILAENYDRKEKITDPKIDLFMKTMFDIQDDELETAAYDWIAESEWFPRPNQLRKSVEAVRNNNGKSVRYQDPDKDRKVYWSAMGLYNASLKGDITEKDLDNSADVKWFRRQQKPAAEINPDFDQENEGARMLFDWMVEVE